MDIVKGVESLGDSTIPTLSRSGVIMGKIIAPGGRRQEIMKNKLGDTWSYTGVEMNITKEQREDALEWVEDSLGFAETYNETDVGLVADVGLLHTLRSALEQQPADGEVLVDGNALHVLSETANKYHTLLMAVDNKFQGESRHDTALRYIREREEHKDRREAK